MKKVNAFVSPANLFTKHMNSQDRINQFVDLLNSEYREGRATTAPELRKTKTCRRHPLQNNVVTDVVPLLD